MILPPKYQTSIKPNIPHLNKCIIIGCKHKHTIINNNNNLSLTITPNNTHPNFFIIYTTNYNLRSPQYWSLRQIIINIINIKACWISRPLNNISNPRAIYTNTNRLPTNRNPCICQTIIHMLFQPTYPIRTPIIICNPRKNIIIIQCCTINNILQITIRNIIP